MKRISLWLLSLVVMFTASAQQITQKHKDRAAALVKQMTLEEKLSYIGGHEGFYIRAIPRLNIPQIRMADGPQGVRNNTKSTMFACGVAAAATWNRSLVNRMGIGLGQDSRARGVHILLGPGVNIYRSPLCGRNFEYFGEDPYLASETAVQYIKGVQSQGVIATVKHFAGNNQEWDRHQVSSDIDERTLQEIYFPAFRKSVQVADVGAVMSSYNPVNGVHASENKELTIDILRKRWGFEGIFMSDWNATYSGVGAANGGLDLEMPSGKLMNQKNLTAAIQSGVVPMATIDQKVQNILQTLIAYGFFDREQLDKSIPEQNPFSDQVALDMAREGIVLLKNEQQFLPLSKGKVVVLGPNSGNIPTGGGSGFVHPFATTSVGQGMAQMGKQFKVQPTEDYLWVTDLTAAGEFFTDASCTQKGLRAAYYANMTFSGAPARSSVEGSVVYDWAKGAPEGLPKDKFSIAWAGVFVPAADGTVMFEVEGDDGYRLLIDGKPLVSDWRNHKKTVRKAALTVQAGKKYALQLDYYDNQSDASVKLSYGKTNPALDGLLKEANTVIYCAGFNSETEKENSDRTFELSKDQLDMIDRIAAINPNLVVVLNAGGAVDFSGWADKAKAVLMAWYPGQVGGTAIAEIITGKISPSGRLPITMEKKAQDNPTFPNYHLNVDTMVRKGTFQKRVSYNEGVFVGYRGYERAGIEPLYPFGFGLSYTTFEYGNLQLSPQGAQVKVSFEVTNTGKFDAADVAQVYVGENAPKVLRPTRELKAYEKVFLKKGEKKRIELLLDREAFAYWDVQTHAFAVNPGLFTIGVGRSAKEILLSGTCKYPL